MTIPQDLQAPLGDVLAGARLAASVIVLREAPADAPAPGVPQVLMLRRAERDNDLRSGVWVFPGGVLDAVDATLHARCEGDTPEAANARLGLTDGALDYSVAAVRECFEEVGLLFAHSARCPATLPSAAERKASVTGGDFVALCERHDLRLQLDALVYHSHWLTPPGIPKRFNTRFYVARLPEGQAAQADEGEAQELAWFTPAEALKAGLKLLPVTTRTLQDLARFDTVQAILDEARARQHPPMMMPRLGQSAQGKGRPVLPDEPAWAEIGRLDPHGQGTVCFELPPLRAVALSPRITRVTCNNGSVMTGPGTNTYLIAEPGSDEVTVLDPGPDDADTSAHLQAVMAAVGPRRVTRIVVTHTHKDHSPAAQALKALTGAPLVGMAALHPEWQDTGFQPDQAVAEGEVLTLGAHTHLQAVHTPGHAANHLCWLLQEEATLFTGDHIMQGSTVVINPPDGDMAAYFRSLERLLAMELRWFAPGHGFLMAEPHAEVRKLLAHRRAREAKVLAALKALGSATALALVPVVYGDVPVQRHGIAARSLTAHLLKLAGEGVISARQGDEAMIWEA
ncbi:MBL fold metallo-hydrolase [Ideonella sp.]|jgi:glyoxylase-like metal-dependent hydrolase (beta-lactamase superfamily II)/8-oxo-dGTP pyrophosphatase MutT (NUDIX family)|uniref:MBL fold metallo-hydrolase n=1 Tax=Ideonella sp. TaxID=1929293 RepID=UPI0037C028EA